MKLFGRPAKAPSPVKLTIYREDEEGKPDNFDFMCGPVMDYKEFDRICPVPKAPLLTNIRTGTTGPDVEDKRYIAKIETWSERRVQWMIIKSISHTPGLQWEQVNFSQPDSWANYESELKSFLTPREFDDLVNAAVEANSPTKNRRKEALENFTHTPVVEGVKDSISQKEELTNIPSGELVDDLASVLPE